MDKASNSCDTGPGFNPVTGQGRFSFSSLESIDKNEDQESLGTKTLGGRTPGDHLVRTYDARYPRAHGRESGKPSIAGLGPSWAIVPLV